MSGMGQGKLAAAAFGIGLLLAPLPARAADGTSPWTAPYPDGESKYFGFHKAGVAVNKAREDLAECTQYSKASLAYIAPPDFVLVGEPTVTKPRDFAGAPMFGLVGDLVVQSLIGGLNRDAGRRDLRRCMTFKGYKRFALTKADWQTLHNGEDSEIISRLAQLAAGAAPDVESLRP